MPLQKLRRAVLAAEPFKSMIAKNRNTEKEES